MTEEKTVIKMRKAKRKEELKVMRSVLEEIVPDFLKMCDEVQLMPAEDRADGVLLHRDAFGWTTFDIYLLGLAAKYAAETGLEVRIVECKH